MVVFGAGASYDSDPYRLPGAGGTNPFLDFRPPLASSLFEPTSDKSRAAAREFARATPIIMRLREAARNGEDIEEVLEQLQEDADGYSGTAPQLLALRAYLSQLLSDLPGEWHAEAAGQTNYVRTLDEAARWRELDGDQREPVALVTFNYDTLLERAVRRVFGTGLASLEDFTGADDLHLYKPHGSVEWRQKARWRFDEVVDDDAVLHLAIDRANELEWTEEFVLEDLEIGQPFQEFDEPQVLWLPALAIPARNKADFIMPAEHKERLIADLAQVSLFVAIGWRAREQHFLRLLQEHMGDPASLVVVAESEPACRATVDQLWETGKFHRYALASNGYSDFSRSPRSGGLALELGRITLRDVLAGHGIGWVNRQPGR